jgi:endo-alpha-1,4-polygalactosaminidase (GH114 family)
LTTPVEQSVDAQVYDIDLFENSASVVSSLHAQGRHVICSLDAGTWEGWRPDASKFPASVLGAADPGWTDEQWLDIRQLSVLEPIMEARLQLCKEKGFDGVELDNVDGYENNTGFPLTAAEQLTYNEWLANAAHALGLSVGLKNDTNQITLLEPYFDFSVDEECFDYSECALLTPFVKAGKAVFEVEYSLEPSQFCAQANALGFMAMKKDLSLEAWNAPCWPQGNWVGAKGAAGYDLAGWDGSSDVSYMPEATTTLVKGGRYEWASQTTDTRALEGPSGSTRSAAAYYSDSQIEVQMHFNAAYKGNLHLYAVDWDKQGRRETIAVDGQTAALSSDFSQGAWISFPISVVAGSTVTITVDRTAGPNAVLSGIFLGDEGAPPTMSVSKAPQGSWVGAYGLAGYDLAGWEGSTTDLTSLPDTSVSLSQGTRYRWVADTTEVRALEAPNGLTRSAAAYTSPTQVRVLLSFTAAYNGNVELYALDWDSTARREIISVNGQSAVLSDQFKEGAWVSFPVSVAVGSTVTVTVDRTAGANAVLSGIFLG